MSAGSVFEEPVDGSFQALVEGHLGLETEEFFGTRDVEPASGLAIGFRGIPADLAFEAGELYNFIDEVLDSDFKPCAYINGFGAVVAFGGHEDALSGVTCINKLP